MTLERGGRIVLLVLLAALLAGCGRSVVVKRERGGDPASSGVTTGPGEYLVRRGDTLYGIAFRNGLDFRDVAAHNGIAAPYTIYPGQRLRLRGGEDRAPVRVTARPTPSPPAGGRGPAPASPAMLPATPTRVTVASPPTTSSPAPSAIRSPAAPTPSTATGGGASGWRWPATGALIGKFITGDPTRQGLDIAGNSGDPVRAAGAGTVVYSGSGLVGYGELIIIKHSDEWLSAYGHNRKRLVSEGQAVSAGQQVAEMGRSGASRDMLHFEIRRNGKPVDPLQHLPRR